MKDFRTFALICARQFGACIMQRDDPMNEPPKLVEASTYHADRLVAAEKELAALQQMTVEEAGRRADAEYAARIEEFEANRHKRRQVQDRYEAMMRDVKAWKSPSSEHVGLREFMLTQLRESIEFDCRDYMGTPEPKTGDVWLAENRARASKDIGYHRAAHEQELDRTKGRNAWIQALYDSLPAP